MIREIALADIETMRAAINAGIDRVELNDRLDLGGLTPSIDTVNEAVMLARENNIDLVVMVRPRGGDFNYSRTEVDEMHRTLLAFKRLGVKQVTFGVLTESGQLAKGRMIRLLEAAQPMNVIFHMAFDDITPQLQPISMSWLKRQGVSRILTHGGSLSDPIEDLLGTLKKTIEDAPEGMTILPGGGITYENAEAIAQTLGVTEVHGSRVVQLA